MATPSLTSSLVFFFLFCPLDVFKTELEAQIQIHYSIYYRSGDRFDCSKLLNRVEPITQTRPEEKTKREKG